VKWLQIRPAPSELPAASPRDRSRVLDPREIPTPEKAKIAAETTQKRAGATPLFRLSPPKKCRGVAPALHAGRVTFFPRLSRNKHFVVRFVVHAERATKGGSTHGTAEDTV
jgi:hypothetical protein